MGPNKTRNYFQIKPEPIGHLKNELLIDVIFHSKSQMVSVYSLCFMQKMCFCASTKHVFLYPNNIQCLLLPSYLVIYFTLECIHEYLKREVENWKIDKEYVWGNANEKSWVREKSCCLKTFKQAVTKENLKINARFLVDFLML